MLISTTAIRQGNLTSQAVAVRNKDNLIKTPKSKYGWPRRRSTESTPSLTINVEVEYNIDNNHGSDDEGDRKSNNEGHRKSDSEGLGQDETNEGMSEREKT